MEGRPLAPMPLEILMRDYYEPRLLPGMLAGDAFSSTPVPLALLNRVQPGAEVLAVERGAGPEEALVKVRVSVGDDATQPNGKTHTDVYDVRLFRDGELVGRSAEEGSDEIGAWRARTHVDMKGAREVTIPFRVQLPTKRAGQSVTFTAYAFNEDRVKSETATASLATVPAGRNPA